MKLTIAASIRSVDGVQWDACTQGKSLLSRAFFRALEDSGAIGRERRIQPRYLTLENDAGRFLGCAPAMLAQGTLTEYGPEIHWLKAGSRQGLFQWPKFQVSLPLFPVLGPKLLCHPREDPQQVTGLLIQGLRHLAFEKMGVGVLDILHVDADLAARLAEEGWLISQEIHSFWTNNGYPDLAAYLDSLPHRKRYVFLQERRRLAEQGVEFRLLPGREITPTLIDQYYNGHVKVCRRYGNRTWLPKPSLEALQQAMPDALVLAAAFKEQQFIAGSLWFISGSTLCMRTWSAQQEIPGLVMDLVCHRPIEFAIARRLSCVDSGLSGYHKRLRGYADHPVFNAHCFRDARLRDMAIRTLRALGQYPWHPAPADRGGMAAQTP